MKKVNLNWKHAVKLFTIFTLFFLTPNIIHAQVFTRILGEKESINDYLPWYHKDTPNVQVLHQVDVEAVLEKDKKEAYSFFRYGIPVNMGFAEKDGDYFKHGSYTIWKVAIFSENAQSLNFEFSNLNLPVGSKLSVYNRTGRMIHGPVVAKNIHNGIYTSDVVYGDYAVIEVYLPNNNIRDFSLRIDRAIHGINRGQEKSFGDSQPCNVNVACPAGNGWENEINAVCLILRSGGSGLCTGTLINNECFDMTPYLLTANHCLGGGESCYLGI